MTPSKDEVLRIPELLENILLQLPAVDLLLAQRVSKKWRNFIQESPQIQEALSFKARPISSLGAAAKPVINPFLQRVLKPIRGGIGNYGAQVCGVKVRGITSRSKCTYTDGDDSGCQSDFHIYLDIDTSRWPAWGMMPQPGTWSEMYASNPPCPIHVGQRWSLVGCKVDKMGAIVDGVTTWLYRI